MNNSNEYYKGVNNRHLFLCPHCLSEAPHKLTFHHCPKRSGETRVRDFDVYWISICEACNEITIWGDKKFVGLVGFHTEKHSVIFPPKETFFGEIPERISKIYQEAKFIIKLSPNGFSVLIRKALEAICDDKLISKGNLVSRLERLVSQEKIPQIIEDITNILRIIGNIGAHEGNEDVSSEYAAVLDEFFRIIIEYVYVIPKKVLSFEESLINAGILNKATF